MSGDASVVRAGDTMLTGHGQQFELLDMDADELPAKLFERTEAVGRFTGERLFLQNPRLYHAIAKLIGRCVPYREIAEICGVSVNTVCGVSFREGVAIETLRERLARTDMVLAQLTAEAAIELLSDPDYRKKISPKDLMIMHGIAYSNGALASGGATAIIQHTNTEKPGHDDYLAYLQNVTPKTTGSRGGNPPAKGDQVHGAIETDAESSEPSTEAEK